MTNMSRLGALLLITFLSNAFSQEVAAKRKALAAKPPMGWNSWDCYGTTVRESEVKANADYMA